MNQTSTRMGHYVRQPTGYTAFILKPLPPEPPVVLDEARIRLLSTADQAVGRLDGITEILPNPELFLEMYIRHEAVESSQIEGTQSTFEDLLTFEVDPRSHRVPDDVTEIVNYIRAMSHGVERLESLPLSTRLIREIHAELLRDGRGADKLPGEFRRSQNWIGRAGVSLTEASFVPPPPFEMLEAIGDLERFIHRAQGMALLLKCGLVHAQFETIHPFLDGNGRVGRLLITLMLIEQRVLKRPLLYLSAYLNAYRADYYRRLTAVHDQGDWEGWLDFFLSGVIETADDATRTARAVLGLRERDLDRMRRASVGPNEFRLLDLLFHQPIVSVQHVMQRLELSEATAGKLLERLRGVGIVEETTGGRRNRRFRYTEYVRLFTSIN